jgi:hypothetical protein
MKMGLVLTCPLSCSSNQLNGNLCQFFCRFGIIKAPGALDNLQYWRAPMMKKIPERSGEWGRMGTTEHEQIKFFF